MLDDLKSRMIRKRWSLALSQTTSGLGKLANTLFSDFEFRISNFPGQRAGGVSVWRIWKTFRKLKIGWMLRQEKSSHVSFYVGRLLRHARSVELDNVPGAIGLPSSCRPALFHEPESLRVDLVGAGE
jgi:hypothetical protein